jgi:large subunit ribosomal protein L9
MKILLKDDVDNLGTAGDIVDVADGYARNYLLPQELAVRATPGQIKQVDVIRAQARIRHQRIADEMAALTEKLESTLLTFEATASERGRLYGSVTQDQIAEALAAELGEPIDRRKIDTDPLRQLGLHAIPIRLGGELTPKVSVIVHREGEDPESYLPVPDEAAGDDDPASEAEVEQVGVDADEETPAEEGISVPPVLDSSDVQT